MIRAVRCILALNVSKIQVGFQQQLSNKLVLALCKSNPFHEAEYGDVMLINSVLIILKIMSLETDIHSLHLLTIPITFHMIPFPFNNRTSHHLHRVYHNLVRIVPAILKDPTGHVRLEKCFVLLWLIIDFLRVSILCWGDVMYITLCVSGKWVLCS